MAVTVLDAFTGTATSETEDPNGSVTISAGSNRAALLGFAAEYTGGVPSVSVMTIGGQTYTAAYELYQDDGAEDMLMYVYAWNEAAIASMSGTTIAWTDDVTHTKRGWTFGTYQDVDQTSFPKGQAEKAHTSAPSTADVVTTSVSGDMIVVFGMNKNPASTYLTWDTLSEVYDAYYANELRHGVANGNGGDDTTTVTVGTGVSQLLNAIVLGGIAAGGASPTPVIDQYYNRLLAG